MTIDELTAKLRSEGYRWWAHDTGAEIRAELCCGTDVLPVAAPRPHGSGATLEAALQAAIVCRNEIVKGLKKKAVA